MAYASRLSPEAKQAARDADLRRWAQHVKTVEDFERILAGAELRTRAALREKLIPMLNPRLSALLTPTIGMEPVDVRA